MPSPARATAFDILLRVETQDAYAAELLHSARLEKLSPADRALCTELVMGVLRWQSQLDAPIAKFSSKPASRLDPEVRIALRLAAYQLLHLGGVPARAAVNESVELVKAARKRSAAPFVNAVLRKLADASAEGSHGAPDDTPQTLASKYAHPLWLVERWINRFGLAATEQICRYDQQVPSAALRIIDLSVEAELERSGIHLGPGELLSGARRARASNIVHTAAFREGRIAIQDEGSQLIALLVGHGARILDCCAAPGGKTAILAQRNPESSIIAADLHSHRARLMRDLLHRAGRNVHVLAADAIHLPVSAAFDRILVDVPCSGTGTLPRHPEIKWRLRPEDLSDLHRRQVAILTAALDQLAPDGRLVYSSCSLEPEECEDVIAEALGQKPAWRVLPCVEELQRLKEAGELAFTNTASLLAGPYLRTLPGIHPCDGFFAALIERA